MEFTLVNATQSSALYLKDNGDQPKSLCGYYNITSKCSAIPDTGNYAGKFQQTDYNVELVLMADASEQKSPEAIAASVPVIAQQWITATYPPIN